MEAFKNRKSLSGNWWMHELVGALSIIVAFLLIANPAAGYSALVVYFGALFLLSGVFRLVNTASWKSVFGNTGWNIFLGVVDFFIGGFLLFRPDIGATALPFFLGFVLVFSGLWLTAFGSGAKNLNFQGSGWFTGLGVLCVILGVIILAEPVFGAGLALAWAALGFFVVGIFNIYFGSKVKKLENGYEKGGEEVRV